MSVAFDVAEASYDSTSTWLMRCSPSERSKNPCALAWLAAITVRQCLGELRIGALRYEAGRRRASSDWLGIRLSVVLVASRIWYKHNHELSEVRWKMSTTPTGGGPLFQHA